ncbi:MAG: hypothetical protein QNJ55_20730 [Xenococcus sp. MO_188.B8]|nr:hypothetical protein [Xenococcus sp. MO_188.B8]
MKNLSQITSIPLTTFATVDSATPTQLDNTKEILTQGGVAVAVILALSIFLLTMNRYQKTQVDSLANLIKTVKKK